MPKAPRRGAECRIVGGTYGGLKGFYDSANGKTAAKTYVIIPESDEGEIHARLNSELVEDYSEPTTYVKAALIQHSKLKDEMRLMCKHLAEIKMGAIDINELKELFAKTLQDAVVKNTGRHGRFRFVDWDAEEEINLMG
jgi:hypothetical protein